MTNPWLPSPDDDEVKPFIQIENEDYRGGSVSNWAAEQESKQESYLEKDKASTEAPNYRQAKRAARSCSTCSNYDDGFCTEYNIAVEPLQVCDSWVS